MNLKFELEICANSVTSAIAAQSGGATRIEFCQNLEAGGTTPSPGQLRLVREKLWIEVHVLIRPRLGDFLYSDIEFEEMKADIRFCKEIGCDGVVIGVLKADGSVDVDRTKELVGIAAPMFVTFHRAFDVASDAKQALSDIIDAGCRRLLTSGMQNTAEQGLGLIKQLVEWGGNRIVIMPGAGINAQNIGYLAKESGAHAFHTSAKECVSSQMSYSNGDVSGMDENIWFTSAGLVSEIAYKLKNL